MKNKARLFLSAKFGLIILLFLMPFINVSCSGMVNIPLTGMDLAGGKTIEMKEPISGQLQKQKINPEPLAARALICAVLGLLACISKSRPARIINAVLAGGGALSMLLLKSKIDAEAIKEGSGMIAVSYQFPFWSAQILFLAAMVVSIYYFRIKAVAKNE